MLTRFIERLVEAASVDDVRHHFCDAMATFGFEHTLYAARFLALPATVLQEDAEIFTNYPKDFADPLLVRRLLNGSHLTRWAMVNSGSIALTDPALDRPDDALLSLIQSHHLHAGRLISLKDKVLRSHGAIMLNPFRSAEARDADTRWSKSHHEISVLSWVMHMRMATILRRRASTHLTNRQREVLEWSSAGKTVAEIGMILGVTAATVEKHLRLARESLGAGNTAQAILKAHLTHQLFPADTAENDVW